jgi:hypothetical protein
MAISDLRRRLVVGSQRGSSMRRRCETLFTAPNASVAKWHRLFHANVTVSIANL